VHSSTHKLYLAAGYAIRVQREKAHLTQEALAEKAGLTRNYIGEVERAERQISLHTLAKIAKALKCRLRTLVPDI
jgi:transcriptional regulator with XRE-family HTH domain